MVFYSPINHTSSKKTKQKQHRMVILSYFLLLLFRHILMYDYEWEWIH